MNSLENTKRKVLLLSLILIAALFIIGNIFLNYQFDRVLNQKVNYISSSTKKLFDLNVQRYESTLRKQLKKIILSDDFNKSIAHENSRRIESIIKEQYVFENFLNKNIKIFSIYLPNGTLLFNANNKLPNKYNYNTQSTILKDSMSTQKSLSGFDYSDFGLRYVVTQPIYYKNQYVGIAEISMSLESYIEDVNAMYSVELDIKANGGLLIDEKEKDYKFISNIELLNHNDKAIAKIVINFDVSELKDFYSELINILLLVGITVAISILVFTKKSFDNILVHFEEQTFIDNLTGLGNRLRLNNDILSSKVNILVLANIKEFSLINELYGIETGNYVLKRLADEFKSLSYKHALKVYRISSDEFALLMYDDVFLEEECLEVIEEFHNRIESLEIPLEEFSDVLQIEVYFGISNGDNNLVEKAQMALKEAKAKSLPYMAYTDNVDRKQSSSKTIKMKKVLKRALDNNKVVPFFQEIRDRNKKIVKYEALVRIIEFEDSKEKIIYPDEFLSIAQNGGLYVYVAKEVLKQSLSFFSNREEKISINFLPSDFFQPKVIDTFLEIVEKFENPKRIIIEITEQDSVGDFNRLLKVVKKLRKLGVGIAIDDFGSGYANYAHILKLKPEYLKIDGSLVRNILEDEESRILVKSIIHFAKDLGIETIAEYVENEEIFELLKEYGVDEFQGYFFGKAQNLLSA